MLVIGAYIYSNFTNSLIISYIGIINSYIVSFVLLWQNTREKQFQRGETYFCSRFQRFQSIVLCSADSGPWWGRILWQYKIVAEEIFYLILNRRQREYWKGQSKILPQRSQPGDLLQSTRPTSYLLPLPSNATMLWIHQGN